MKKLVLLLLVLSAPAIGFCEGSSARVIVFRLGSGGGAAASPAVETVGAALSSGTVTSATQTFTCTANTNLLLVGIGSRRNAGQQPSSVTWNGLPLTLSTAAVAYQMYASLWYLQNPGAGTAQIVVTYPASVPGFQMSSISFTNATVAPANPGFNATQSVATTSATATTVVNDILLDYCVKQDSSTVNPTLTTAGATLQKNSTLATTGGNGGWTDLCTLIATGVTSIINLIWSDGAKNCSHVWCVIKP